MSKRSTKTRARTHPTVPAKKPVGSRAFTRRSLSTQRQVKRRQTMRARATPQRLPSLRVALRRIPTAAWLCALVACLNAVSWSFITPPFQVPDEPSHIAYVKQLAETGSLPTSSENGYSQEETFALEALRSREIRLSSDKAIFSAAEQGAIQQRLGAFEHSTPPGSAEAGVATTEPPLYYTLESIPYSLGGTLLDRIQLMRLLSALFAGLTVLFTFLFLRETLPRVRFAWTVGALGVAFSPLFGFMSG
jgi:hypothetical protein